MTEPTDRTHDQSPQPAPQPPRQRPGALAWTLALAKVVRAAAELIEALSGGA